MTTRLISTIGAPNTREQTWDTIAWHQAKANVRRLQIRIAKAYREGKPGKVKALQWLLTHSRSAKLLAVKRVTENRGGKTPGVDKVVWRTANQKLKAVSTLKRHGYQPQPLRRIYIPKKLSGKLRPLSIPTMTCRAQQALHLFALEPIAETMADKNAYGFRPHRSTADAIGQCFIRLARRDAAQHIFEADIKTCFDSISHPWLLNNIPMDKAILEKWLKAGYTENQCFFPTSVGTPQGSLISPSLLVITLSGLEAALQAATTKRDKVHLCTYADDFIVTSASPEVLTEKVRPVVESFLAQRGLVLSPTKTRITHISEGFNFLGTNIRKYKGKLICKPAKDNLQAFLHNVRNTIKSNATAKTENLIRSLNPKIRGWANYHSHICAKRTFSKVDHIVFEALWRWAVRRHPHKGAKWIRKKYFRTKENRHWVFSATSKDKQGYIKHLELVEAQKTPIKRHIKIIAKANPYDPAYLKYFEERLTRRKVSKKKNQVRFQIGFPWWEIDNHDG
ncbi:MAG: group II intron reverse transcriptase/maturase [Alphaproteobacteria bacterium]|nr:group II intron reverse transcriptase/maturase [Alphaproteobacteria bacterium]